MFAFGDSITQAQGFDSARSSKCGNQDLCGYPGRLADSSYFDCGGKGDCLLENEGKAGERTASGVTRIQGVLNKRSWDLVMLMEGSNDTRKFSAQTIEFNLAVMADKAAAKGVEAVHGSIIRHLASDGRSVAARNAVAQELRARIQSRASSNGRCFADPWSRLCTSSSCFSQNYWKPPAGKVDPVGHPNSKGFDVLAAEFWKHTGGKRAPGAPSPKSPSGKICGSRPELVWNKETVSKSSCGNWFRVVIDGPSGKAFDRWHRGSGLCSGSTCRLSAPVSLKTGTNSFRVQTRNTAGYGPFSADQSFEVVAAAPKQVTTLYTPDSEIFAAGGVDPAFEWKRATIAESYHLEVFDENGKRVVNQEVGAEEACPGSRCSLSGGTTLGTGSYTWRVLATNICGGTWSPSVRFTVFDSPPEAPQALAPSAPTFDPTPILRWRESFGADSYEIEEPLGGTVSLSREDVCSGGICRWESRLLNPGPYSWRVRASNPLGNGDWSEPVAFDLRACDCSEGQHTGGARFLMAVPTAWNGDLVLWNHASNFFGVRVVDDLGPLAVEQLEQGYAVAATSYSVPGWPVFRSNTDLKKLVTTFTARHGKPGRVFLVGEGSGSLVAVYAVEKGKFGKIDGALTMCGPMAGSPNWQGAFDMWMAFRAVCGDVPGAGIEGNAKGLPRNHDVTVLDLAAAVNRCTGLAKDRSKRSRLEKDRLNELLRVLDIPEGGLQEAMELAVFGFSDLVRDKKKLKNRLPVGNESVNYGSAALNASIQRIRADAPGRRKLRRFYDPNGRVKGSKVLSIHTSKDAVFLVENQREYAALAPEDNFLAGVAVEKTASHCGFTDAERLGAWNALVGWVDRGGALKGRDLESSCRAAQNQADGGCRFDARFRLGRLDSRIRPR